jgi:hypothetical protein
LENFSLLKQKEKDKFSASFPPISSFRSVWNPTMQLLTLPSAVHISLRKPNEALNCAIILLSALTSHAFDVRSLSLSSMKMLPTLRLLEFGHRIFDCYGRLARLRCLDRRKLVYCFDKLISQFMSVEKYHTNQQLIDLLARSLYLLSPTDSQDVQANLAQFLFTIQSSHSITADVARFGGFVKIIEKQKLELSRYAPIYQV